MKQPSICGIDCSQCPSVGTCKGCKETGGDPFGGGCVVANCCRNKLCTRDGTFANRACALKKQLLDEINGLGIDDMETVTDLNALVGRYINLEYALPNGRTVKLLRDDKVYLGNQVEKKNSDRCYGIAADETILLVCEYGENGSNAEIVAYKRRRCYN